MSEELPKEFPKLIPILENKFENLKKAFERFFMGLERVPPLKERDELKRQIFSIVDKKGYQYHLLFRAKQLAIKFNTYNSMWERTLKRIEEGKPIEKTRRPSKIGAPAKKAEEEEWVEIKKGEELDEGLGKLYSRLRKEVERRGLNIMDRNKFFERMKAQIKNSLSSGKKLKLKVVISSGKVKVKVRKEE